MWPPWRHSIFNVFPGEARFQSQKNLIELFIVDHIHIFPVEGYYKHPHEPSSILYKILFL